MVSECCLGFTKYFLFFFNLIFFLLGMLLFSVGLWIIFDKASFLSYGSTPMSGFSFFLVIGGTVTMVLGFFGCLGALNEVKCMLGMYFILLTILLAAEIVGGVLLFTQKTTIESTLQDHVLELIASYPKNKSSEEDYHNIFDYIQREIECCGWNGPSDWKDNEWPCSCYMPPNTTNLKLNQSDFNSSAQQDLNIECSCYASSTTQCRVYEKGCMENITKWFNDNNGFILGLLLAVAAIELNGMILSMYLFRWISLEYDFLNHFS